MKFYFIASLLWCQKIATKTKRHFVFDCPSSSGLLTEVPGHSWIDGLGKSFVMGDLFYSLTKLIHHRCMVALHEQCCKLEIVYTLEAFLS